MEVSEDASVLITLCKWQTYKQIPKSDQNEPIELPSELAEIVAVWPELPGHIKAEINALVKTNSSKKAE